MLNNISFLALFVFLTSCFTSVSVKLHSAFSHLTVDGILLQLVNGTGVFLGVLQSAMAEKAGNGFDIGTVVV